MLLGLSGGSFVVLLAPLLYVVLWPTFGVFTTGAVVAGSLCSVLVRAWNDRHPATLARRRGAGREPELNLSGIPVGGDVGGFLFAVASVVMMCGLPGLRGFLLGATTAALLLACARHVWYRRGPQSPVRRIIGS
jgi:hypothetical protein